MSKIVQNEVEYGSNNAYEIVYNNATVGDTLDNLAYLQTTGATNIEVAHNTITKIAEINIEAGVYLAIGRTYFPSNATGYRETILSTGDTTPTPGRYNSVRVTSISGVPCIIESSLIFSQSESTKITQWCRHTANTTLSGCGSYLQVVRIK